MKGLFITFEGGEGSGKTTIAKMVQDELIKEGHEVILTREPGGVKISEQIRDVIVDTNNKEMDSKTEALLYAASRRQHLVEKVFPALQEGKIVICDRYLDSSLVYQGIARGIGIDEVYTMNLFATDNKLPDLTLFFDIDPQLGLQRINSNSNREINRLDLESLEFHKKVYNGYLTICNTYTDRIKKIDASQSIEDVFNQVMIKIRDIL